MITTNKTTVAPEFYDLSEPQKIREEFEQNGFAIFRNVIDSDLIAEANNHVQWLTQKYPNLRPEHFHHPLMRDDAFWVRLVSDERLQKIANIFLGPELACFTAHYICKPAFDGHAVLWHQDGAYWNLQPMNALTLWLAIDASNCSNGCLKMIPGSHKLPLLKPEQRSDVPNMLFSSVESSVVRNWLEKVGVVDIELNPGDVSIHHPNIIHGSEPNTSPNRRCGLDMGFITPSTKICNQGLYLDPLLIKGEPVEGINSYRPYPEYSPGETVEFRASEEWNLYAQEMNQRYGFAKSNSESVMQVTQRMIDRLQEGTLKEGN